MQVLEHGRNDVWTFPVTCRKNLRNFLTIFMRNFPARKGAKFKPAGKSSGIFATSFVVSLHLYRLHRL